MVDLTLSHYGAMGNGIDDDTYAIMLSLERQGSAIMEANRTYKVKKKIELLNQSITGGGTLMFVNPLEHGVVHIGGNTVHDYKVLGFHENPQNGIFGVTSVDGADGFMDVRSLHISGFTNGLKIDENIAGFIDCLVVQDLNGNQSGEGYGALIAGKNIILKQIYTEGDRPNKKGRHGVYFSATAQNIKADYIEADGFMWEGFTAFAYEHQHGVNNIDVKKLVVRDSGGGIHPVGSEYLANSVGAVSVLGKCKNVNIYDYKVENSYGSGIFNSAHTVNGGCDNINYYNGKVKNSAYSGVFNKGSINCNFYGGEVVDSSKAIAGSFSNICIMSWYENEIKAENNKFYNFKSLCTVKNLTRNAYSINPSTPLPEGTEFVNCELDGENFAIVNENI